MSDYLFKLRNKKYYLLFLSLSSAFLLSLSWYSPFTPLAFVALVPLLEMEDFIAKNNYSRPRLTFFLYAYLSIVLWNFGVYWWLWYASQETTFAAWGANALLQVLPLVFFQTIKRASNNKYNYIGFVVFWVTFEYIHLHWDLSWVWLNMGNVFANFPAWVQWYEYTGSFGGTIWVLWANVLAYQFLYQKQQKKKFVFAFFVIVPILFSYALFYSYEETGKEVEFVLIQPNLDCYNEKFSYNARTGAQSQNYVPYPQQVKRFIKLSQEAITENTQFVIFPETSLHKGMNEKQPQTSFDFLEVRSFINKYPKVSLIAGVDSYFRYDDEKSASQTARFSKGFGFYDKFNTALFISDTDEINFYNKSKLVIGAETIPFAPVLKPIMLNLGGTFGRLGQQKEREIFTNSEGISVAPIICYESVYGEFVTEYVKKGATLMTIITNDGWWENTPGHVQHLRFGALRAIETRRSIARAANTGVSGFINQKGAISKASKYDEMIAVVGSIKENAEITFYVKYGDYLGRLAAFLSIMICIAAFVQSLMPKKK